jgi:hypothetical protein
VLSGIPAYCEHWRCPLLHAAFTIHCVVWPRTYTMSSNLETHEPITVNFILTMHDHCYISTSTVVYRLPLTQHNILSPNQYLSPKLQAGLGTPANHGLTHERHILCHFRHQASGTQTYSPKTANYPPSLLPCTKHP